MRNWDIDNFRFIRLENQNYGEAETMSLFEDIKNYKPLNQQEECDKERMLQYN